VYGADTILINISVFVIFFRAFVIIVSNSEYVED
jgi:hypothetical protein